MKRIDALEILMREAQDERLTKTGLRRIRKAAKALELTNDELIEVECILEYRNRFDGEHKLLGRFENV